MEKLPPKIQELLKQRLVKRLPVTFQPFFNQELREWDSLWPYEQGYIVGMLDYLGHLDEASFKKLFEPLHALEARMGVQGEFSTREESLEEASILARSPYYVEWQREVQQVNEEINHGIQRGAGKPQARNRLILLVIPARLVLDPATLWKHWREVGRPLAMDLSGLTEGGGFLETLLGAAKAQNAGGLLGTLSEKLGWRSDEIWALEGAPHTLAAAWNALGVPTGSPSKAVLLSFPRLKPFRENFLHQLNTMQKDLADADRVLAQLRAINVQKWCPPEISEDHRAQQFVRSVFLSGNGALLFGSAFVEWAASEGFRRARPSFVLASYGIRNRPKPFTSVAIFENQDKVSPLPDVEDLAGSALDAEVLSYYTWRAAMRYPEYARTACLCVAENHPQAYLVAPRDFPLANLAAPIPIERLALVLRDWLV